MNGILEKKEEGWFIKWSDLHSYGTHWMWTPLHPTEVIDEKKYKNGDKLVMIKKLLYHLDMLNSHIK